MNSKARNASSITLGILAVLSFLAGLLASVAAPTPAAATPTGNVIVDPSWQPVGATGGAVSAIVVQPDGKVLIGGSFDLAGGVRHRGLARLNATGTVDPGFVPDVVGGVSAISLQPDGKLVIGGDFTEVNGVARGGLARLNANGTLDVTFNLPGGIVQTPGVYPLAQVTSIGVAPDGKIVIGGSFSSAGGVARSNIARLHSSGSLDALFTAAANATVRALVVQPDGKPVLAGDFTTVGGGSRTGIARVTTTGSLDGSFNPGAGLGSSAWPGAAGTATSLVIRPDGRLVVGGTFDSYNGTTRMCVAGVNNNGTLEVGFDPAASVCPLLYGSPSIRLALVADGKVVFSNSTQGAYTASHLGRLNANGSTDSSFNGVDGWRRILAVAVQVDGRPLAGGSPSPLGDGRVAPVFRLQTSGALDVGFVAIVGAFQGFDGAVMSVAVQPDGKLVAGGTFSSYNSTTGHGVARLNPDGTLDESFNTGTGTDLGPFTMPVEAVALQPDGKVLVGGNFGSFNGEARSNIVRLNPNGSVDAGFNPGSAADGGSVYSLAIQPDGKVLVGGSFTVFSGLPRSGIVRLNPNGSVDATFGPGSGIQGPSAQVKSVVLAADGKVLIGGRFATFNGVARSGIARLLSNGSLDVGFNPGSGFTTVWQWQDMVTSLAVQSDGRVVAAGGFTTVAGVARARIARLNTNGALDLGFNPGGGFTLSGSNPADASADAVRVNSQGRLVVTGQFDAFDGVPRSGMARLMPSGALDTGFDPGTGIGRQSGQSMGGLALQADGRIIVGGGFEGFNDAFPKPSGMVRIGHVAPSGAPTGLSVTNGEGAALVSFTAPTTPPGVLVTNYGYSVDGGGWVARVPASAVPAVTVPGLVNGNVYQVRVRAVNAAGPGAVSVAVTVRPVAQAASVFVPTGPVRVVDSRVSAGGAGPIPGGTSRVVSVVSPVGGGAAVVPAGAVAVAYNLTVPSPVAGGHVRVMPGDAVGLTSASAVNFRAGESIANAATVKVAADRTVKVYAGSTADVIIDVVGYFVPAAVPMSTSEAVGAAGGPVSSGRFTPVTPIRVYDAVADPGGLLAGGADRVVSTASTQSGGVPVVPSGASAVVYNLTVVGTTGAGHLRVMPGDVGASGTSAINWSTAGERIANGSVVAVDSQRRIRVFNGGGTPVRFLVDVVGYYSATGAAFFPVDPVRTTDTRYVSGGAGPVAPVGPGVRAVSVASTQAGGMPVTPVGAAAIAYNATVAATGSLGHLRVYPAGSPLVDASVLNWPGAGYTRANATAVGVSAGRQITLYNGATTATDVLVDINGYYK